MDGLTIAAAADVLARAAGMAKGIYELARASKQIEMTNMVIELQGAMLDVREKLADASDENRALREELRRLQDTSALLEKREFHHNAYWIRLDDGTLDGPYSTQKWDLDSKTLRLSNFGCDLGKVRFTGNGVTGEDIHVPEGFLIQNGMDRRQRRQKQE